ncbi:MAG: CCA tRNA nucleotidyltransferase [Deltaproteobacteria bacterium]
MIIKLNKTEAEILRTISEAASSLNLEAHVIGGFVRDKILGRPCKDIDITCVGDGIHLAIKTAELMNIKKEVHIFKNFGTAMLKFKGYVIEFVGARKESYNYSSRKPLVSPGSLMDDLLRRDFTINTLSVELKNIESNTVYDPFNGLTDLENKTIRTPQSPEMTFSDDPLRMMRAIRFASQLDFNIEETTFTAISSIRERIKIVSEERVTDELQKIIACKKPGIGFRLLFESGLLEIIFPEMFELKGVETKNGISHKDNLFHTIQVLDNLSEKTENIWLRWAAIMHDIGKAKTKKFQDSEGWTFHGHEIVGASMTYNIFKRMKLPLDNKMKYVQKLVKLHLRPMALVNDTVSDSAVRRLLFDAGDDIDDLMLLARADITSKNMVKIQTVLKNYDLVIEKLKEVEEKDKLRNWQPPVSGEMIMNTFGLSPGREIGIIKNEIREAILDGMIKNDFHEAYKFMLSTGEKMGFRPLTIENQKTNDIS